MNEILNLIFYMKTLEHAAPLALSVLAALVAHDLLKIAAAYLVKDTANTYAKWKKYLHRSKRYIGRKWRFRKRRWILF